MAAGGLISAAAYWFVCAHMNYRPHADRKLFRHVLRGLQYMAILFIEIVKANIAVFRIVFSPTIRVEPRLVFFRTHLRSNIARVALANSITLTPGTITVSLNDDMFCVHCLTEEMSVGLDDSVFVQRLEEFED